jgi:hypothetical protein
MGIIFRCIIRERNKKPYLFFYDSKTTDLRLAHRRLYRLFGDNVGSYEVI